MSRVVFFIFVIFFSGVHIAGHTEVYTKEHNDTLNLATAKKITNACIKYAELNDLKMAVAVYDVYGQLMTYAKMDGVFVAASKISQWKGFSAAIYRYSTEESATWKVPNAPDIATIPGGLPIFSKDGRPQGGVGVSGALPEADVKCAEAGIISAGLLFSSAAR